MNLLPLLLNESPNPEKEPLVAVSSSSSSGLQARFVSSLSELEFRMSLSLEFEDQLALVSGADISNVLISHKGVSRKQEQKTV